MPSQQMLIGLGGGGAAATDIASLHGVSSSASTVVSLKKSDDVCCGSNQPAGWGDFPYNTNNGLFISGFWATTEDDKGIYKATASDPYDTPTGLTVASSASGVNLYPGYNISSSVGTSAQTSTTGGFAYVLNSSPRTDHETYNYTFSSGLGSALGFVIQGYGSYGAGTTAWHKAPMVKITINSITRMYAAKGNIANNSTTSAGTGASGFVVYPMSSSYTNWLSSSDWSGISGTQLASSYFEY